ncbi:ribosomal protein S18 [Hypomontagnella monticulosa]|nr:ribosomal protein S18 [Hypomontagnella monticulosa]
MPPRIPFLGALRQPSKFFKFQTASISSTKPQSLRTDVPTTTSSLLDIDPPAAPSSRTRNATEAAAGAYNRIRSATRVSRPLEEELREGSQQDDYLRQMTRRWKVGDVYAPHDLSPSEMSKWRRARSRKKDVVDMLGLRPLDMYRNFAVIAEFTTPHGRIKKASETGLRPPNQRKMAKAIRRAIGLGIHPSVHKHPELLVRENQKMYEQNIATFKRNF